MRKIIIKTNPCIYCGHFVHYMEYLYWCIDIILNETVFECIIVEPLNKSDSRYVNSFKRKILEKFPNVTFINEKRSILKKILERVRRIIFKYKRPKYSYKRPFIKNLFNRETVYKEYVFSFNSRRKGYFYLNNKIIPGSILDFFPNNKSHVMRNLFFNNEDNIIKIGLVNRQKNRILINHNELSVRIKEKFNINVDTTYFEDKSFEYQTKFFNDHKIIISPHGAQLCSIPFAQDDSLIIECVHEEWHPYPYFPSLSFTSNKYHCMICDDHKPFPQWWTDKYINKKRGSSDNSRLNIVVNIDKIINVIDIYLKNNNKLENYYCHLL